MASDVITLLAERTRMLRRQPLHDAITQLGLGQQDRLRVQPVDHPGGPCCQQRQTLPHLLGVGRVNLQPARVARRIGIHQHRLRRGQQALHVVARQRAHLFRIHWHRIQLDAMRCIAGG